MNWWRSGRARDSRLPGPRIDPSLLQKLSWAFGIMKHTDLNNSSICHSIYFFNTFNTFNTLDLLLQYFQYFRPPCHNFNTAAAHVGFMLTYRPKCNIVAEITVSDFFPKNFQKIKKRRRKIILAMLFLG